MDFDELQLMFHSDAVREKKIELAQKRKEADISLEESERKRYYERLYETDNTKLINDIDRNHIRKLIPNSNFEKQEFRDLWNKINYQSVY